MYDALSANTRKATNASWIPRISFSAEKRAYEALQRHPDLELYAPKFFGSADPRSYKLDSARAYPSGCGLIIEKIPGDDTKVALLPARIRREVEKIAEQIRDRAGLNNVWDASCFVPGTRADFALIGFSNASDALWRLDNIVKRHGDVPRQYWGILGLEPDLLA